MAENSKKEIGEYPIPETYSEELWELQGKVKALEGYLRWADSEILTTHRSVSVRAVAKIMGFDLDSE